MASLSQLKQEASRRYADAEVPRLSYGLGIRNPLKGFSWDVKEPGVADDHFIAPDGVVFCSLKEAAATMPDLLEKYLADHLPENKFLFLHLSHLERGAMLYVPKGKKVEMPLFHRWASSSGADFSHLLIVVDEGAEVCFEEICTTDDAVSYQSKGVEIVLENDAHLTYRTAQDASIKTFHHMFKRARIAKGATMDWLDVTLGSSQTKGEVLVELLGEGATIKQRSVFLSSGEQLFDVLTTLDHRAKRTTSHLFVHGALKDTSRTIFRGLVRIGKDMPGCVGSQKEETLMLSDQAEADMVPVLEIDNDDVQCTHSASVSTLDEKKLFYLQTRGISAEMAEAMVVEGFFSSFIDDIQSDEMKAHLTDALARRY